MSDIIQDAFNSRGKSDYMDFFEISKDEIIKQIQNAEEFLTTIENFLT